MIGKVAKCRRGWIGLILRISKVRSLFITGNDTAVYHGICLDKGRVGQAWQSIHPEVIGTLDDWVKIRYAEIVEAERSVTVAIADDTPTKRNLST